MLKSLGSNIVVIAQNLNPSIFSQLWLVKVKAFLENEMQANSIYSPAAVNVETTHASLLVVPERMQLTFKTEEKEQELINNTLTNIIKELPHTPYKAIGFNFDWIVEPKDPTSYPAILRDTFLSSSNPLRTSFTADDARFGMYLSKNEFGMRLRLDIKPIFVGDPSLKRDALHYHFNYHKDIGKDHPVEAILTTAAQWANIRTAAHKMVKEATEGWRI